MKSAKLDEKQQQNAIGRATAMLRSGIRWNGCAPPIPEWEGAIIRLHDGPHQHNDYDDVEDVDEIELVRLFRELHTHHSHQTPLKTPLQTPFAVRQLNALILDYLRPAGSFVTITLQRGVTLRWEEARAVSQRIPLLAATATADVTAHCGVRVGAFEELDGIVRATPLAALRRLMLFIGDHQREIRLPPISRDGGATQEIASLYDVRCFHLLTHICRLFPAALKPGTAPATFVAPLGPLLWLVRDRIRAMCRPQTALPQTPSTVSSSSSSSSSLSFSGASSRASRPQTSFAAAAAAATSVAWRPIGEVKGQERVDWEHQTEAVDEMQIEADEGRKGHFLWFPVGLGKSRMVIRYFQRRWAQPESQSCAAQARFVLYLLPASAIKAVADEFLSFGAPVTRLSLFFSVSLTMCLLT
jgi:hypothetical protein